MRPDGPLLQDLKTLTRDLDGLGCEQTRRVNQLTACLNADYPVALRCFDGLTRRVTLAFLRAFPTPEAARHADLGPLTAVLLTAVLQSVHSPRAQAKAAQLQQLLQTPQVEATAGIARGKARLLVALGAQLEVLVEPIAAYDQAIEQLFAQQADHALFASLPGAGHRLAPRLLAEWGDDRAR